MRPKKSEVEAVVALLESSDFEDASSLASAVLKEAWEQLTRRSLYNVAVRVDGNPDGPTLLYGPYGDLGAAKRALKAVGSGGPAAVFHCLPSGVLADRLAVLDESKQPEGLF